METTDQIFDSLKLVNVVITGQVCRVSSNLTNDEEDDSHFAEWQRYQQAQNNKFELATIASRIQEASAEYYPRNFAALKLCRTHPFSKALFFRSGKLVCVGNVTQEIGRTSMDFFSRCIDRALGGGYELKNVKTQNIVATTQLTNPVAMDLNLLARLYPNNTQYEPELFPGCSFRYGHNWRKVVNIFNSGKIVMTGVKSIQDMKMLARLFHSDLYKARHRMGIMSAVDAQQREASLKALRASVSSSSSEPHAQHHPTPSD
tara:strand:- start:173 stop:952 length:780 start_codon:yes stop_codon:yes gene_type:complete